MINFFYRKKLSLIKQLKEEVTFLKNQLNEQEIVFTEKLNQEKKILTDRCRKLSKYENILEIDTEIENKKTIIENLSLEIKQKKKELIQLDDSILLQEFGYYEPVYNFPDSEDYKSHLKEIKNEQKQLIKDEKAVLCNQEWSINDSISQGQIFITKNIKLLIRSFNNECDILISKVKFNNAEAYIHKIIKSYDDLNRLNEPIHIQITQSYLNLKLKELRITYEYSLKKQKEKEEQRAIREQLREEAKLMEEIELRRKEVLKELSHYNKQIIKITDLLSKAPNDEKEYLNEKKVYIENRLTELEQEIKDMDYREANKKAGYVYIISNIGAFGENIYKIGMTRRLEPMDRIDELSNASVPFKFDVHAIIFSENAPQLESALHKAFSDKKVNMINNRKEFFRVTISEIENIIKQNYEKAVEFTKEPIAEQYRETLKILEQ